MIRRATLTRGRLGVVAVLDHHRELVAAEARDHVLGAQARAQPRGDRHQQLVAGGVAEAVVDGLEVVEVDEQHRELAAPVGDRGLDLVGEQRSVGEVRERVVVGLVVELLLEDRQLHDGLLEAVVLERDARVAGERVEQSQVVVVERAHDAEAVGEHDRADHALLAGERCDHRVGHAAGLEVALQASPAERGVERDRAAAAALEQLAHRVGDLGVDRLHQLAVAARADAASAATDSPRSRTG